MTSCRRLLRPFSLLLFAVAMLAGTGTVQAQDRKETIQRWVDSLSWNTITMNCEGTMLVLKHSDSAEQALVAAGKEATPQLIAALAIPSKTAIAHIILSQLWDNTGDMFGLATVYIYKNCNQLDGWHHVYNGLVWEWNAVHYNSIRPSEIEKITQYWQLRTTGKAVKKWDQRQITTAIFLQDQADFPCDKVYDNKSSTISYPELERLFGKNSRDTAFTNLWSRLGNDSTRSYFDDCYFIKYGPEGLTFRFESDSLLSTIFFSDDYEGELPFGISLKYKRDRIVQLLGKPDDYYIIETDEFYQYKGKGLFFKFDKGGRIGEFYVTRE